jgi:hypothetical protein
MSQAPRDSLPKHRHHNKAGCFSAHQFNRRFGKIRFKIIFGRFWDFPLFIKKMKKKIVVSFYGGNNFVCLPKTGSFVKKNDIYRGCKQLQQTVSVARWPISVTNIHQNCIIRQSMAFYF